tara:strand:+ start:824 stop:976 length:153 start_codon:yes stop_codon:yes gene_type:complete
MIMRYSNKVKNWLKEIDALCIKKKEIEKKMRETKIEDVTQEQINEYYGIQ